MERIASTETASNFPGFEILGVLGEGGMGTVYRARDLVGRRDVALKEIRGDCGDLDRERFRREIRTLSLIQHEGIVRFLDVRRHGDREFYLMECVEGLPLARFLDSPLPDLQEIVWLVTVVVRALEAIDYLHRARLVHRDLKPGNIMVLPSAPLASTGELSPEAVRRDPNPLVRLMDFGLVRHLSDPRDEETHEPGTALYIAPERADPRAPLDRRSDLYAIGVLLHQAVTRAFPFERVSDAFAVPRRSVPPPERRNPACPPRLSDLILRQLSREPRRRADTAGELRQELLDSVDLSGRFPPRIHAPAFAGRSREIESLSANLRETSSGGGRCVLLGGARGAGKTWLLERSGLKARAVLDLGIACHEGSYEQGGPIHGGLRSVLAGALLGLADEVGAEGLLEALEPSAHSLLRTLRLDAIGSPVLDHLLASLTPPPADPGPELAREQVLQTALRILTLKASRSPLLVILENLEHAEALDREILRRVVPALEKLPLTIVATYRDEAVEGNPDLARWVHEMSELDAASERVERVHLAGLGDSDVEKMARAMLEAAPPGAGLLGALLAETDGIPGRVEETLRDLWSRGRIVRREGAWEMLAESAEEAGGRVLASALDAAMRELDSSRLEVLLAASVIGDRFDTGTLAALLESDHELVANRLPAILRHLAEQGLLEGWPGGYRFAAPSIREHAKGICEPELRRRYHRRLARRLLASGASGGEDRWFVAARHLERGGEADEAADLYVRFARHAESRGSYQRSLDSYKRALRLMPEAPVSERRAGILGNLGKLHSRLGEFDAALACLKEATAGVDNGPALVHLLEEEGRIHQRRGDLERARELFERCQALAAGDDRQHPGILYRLGSVHFDRGDLEMASDCFGRSLKSYEERKDPAGMAMVLLGLGLVEKRRGELGAAVARIEESIACSERAGKTDQTATSLHNLANLHRVRGNHDGAIDCFHRSIELRKALGDRLGIAICLNNLSRAFAQRGEIRNALGAAEEAFEIFAEVGDRQGVLISGGNIGGFRYFQGDLTAAEEIFRRNLDRARRARHSRAGADSLCSLGRLENAMGIPGAAEEVLLEGLRALPRSGDAGLRASLLAELALARLQQQNREGAQDALREGWECAQDGDESEIAGVLHTVSSEFHLRYGDAETALDSARKAVKILDRAGWQFDAALAHRQLARVYREIGPDWVDRTESHLEIARKTFEAMGSRFELGRTLLEEGRLWELLEEFEEAGSCLRRAVALFRECGAGQRAAEAERELDRLP